MSYADVRHHYEEPPDDPLPWEEVIRNAARDAARELMMETDGGIRETPENLVDAIAAVLPGIYVKWAEAGAGIARCEHGVTVGAGQECGVCDKAVADAFAATIPHPVRRNAQMSEADKCPECGASEWEGVCCAKCDHDRTDALASKCADCPGGYICEALAGRCLPCKHCGGSGRMPPVAIVTGWEPDLVPCYCVLRTMAAAPSKTPWLDAYMAVETEVKESDADARHGNAGEIVNERVRNAFAKLCARPVAGP